MATNDSTRRQFVRVCECGCGQPTLLAHYSVTRIGWIRGQPVRFVNGHNRNGQPHPTQRKAVVKRYRTVSLGHNQQMLASRALAEAALGHSLPPGAEVHHIDRDIGNPHPRLVICQDRGYHMLLHQRERIVKAGGNPNTDKICTHCKQSKPFEAFARDKSAKCGRHAYCRPCDAIIRHERPE